MAEMILSAVRLPTPEPALDPAPVEPARGVKRHLSPSSRSPTPKRHRSPTRRRPSYSRSPSPDHRFRDGPSGPLPRDVDRSRAFERQRQLEVRQRQQEQEAQPEPLTEEQKQEAAKAEYQRLLNARSGGVYVPPAKLRQLQAQITDKTSKEYQRMAWEALKKSINGLVNKVNVSNIKHIVPELFGENLVRGRGLFARSLMKAQAASLPFTAIYAALVAIVNTKLPQVGELLVNRLIVQFRKAFKRNDKAVCLSSTTFIAHLANQQVVNEMLAAQILLLLLHKPTDDSVEIAVGLTREVGQHLEEMSQPIALAVFDQFRSILHESDIDKRVQYMIEVLFQVRKDKYKDNPAIKDELDLVDEEDQITHATGLDDEIDVEDGLNIFKFDPEWQEHEDAYKTLNAEIMGEANGSDAEDDEYETDSSEDEEDKKERALEVQDQSSADIVSLRRTIYLTIKSSGGFEECCHKLMRINLPVGQEEELPSMIIECASQERTYDKFYGNIGERFCKLNRMWKELFEGMFAKYYDTIHRKETNRLRIIAQFFGYLISTDSIDWHVLSLIHLNEEETTSSSRIFIKILFEDLSLAMGMPKLVARFKDEVLAPSLGGLFPQDPTNQKNTRFAINFFTAIGMGALTEGMREWLKNVPKPAPPPLPAPESESDSESVSSYSTSYSESSSRRSRSPDRRGRSISRSRSPPTRNRRRSYSSSMSRSPSRSRSPPPRSRRRSYTESRSPSRSRSPVRRRRSPSYSVSRSRTPPKRGAKSPARKRYDSVSRSPPPRRRRYSSDEGSRRRSSTRSPSPPPRKNGVSVNRDRSISPVRRNGGRRSPEPRHPVKRSRRSSSSEDEDRGYRGGRGAGAGRA